MSVTQDEVSAALAGEQPTKVAARTPSAEAQTSSDNVHIICGPLLNFKGTHYEPSGIALWKGSVLIVTQCSTPKPELVFRFAEALQPQTHGDHANQASRPQNVTGQLLYAEPKKAFWRFEVLIELLLFESCWEYSISNATFASAVSSRSFARKFILPSKTQSMRIMFHSCNGFSVGTDEDAWSGPALWNDVLRFHRLKPFHVMVGGGDQIYNDGVRVDGPLRAWSDIGNPSKRKRYPFDETLRQSCDDYYFNSYVSWFAGEPFASANSQIPQINIWDDHDIIDGFGSYTDHFMRCDVFRGIGGVSFKYYCLFQQHIAPPVSTYTTSSKATQHANAQGTAGADPDQIKDTFIHKEAQEDSSWIIGLRPGPYVEERSRSIYMRLGARIALVGVDARTERTRHQVNYPDTYDLIFNRALAELSSAPEIKHLIVLLGIPIAYPRLVWLENIFSSPIIGPIRFLSRRFGLAGGFFNNFDGQVDLLDDLDDHYTAKHHKKERKNLMLRLQALAHDQQVRVSILSGDVHLGAVGRFYSNPKLQIPAIKDFRFMPNIISSAITNKPPPAAIANLLARRNRIHHLDHDTDETLMKLFDRDPDGRSRSEAGNRCTMPSRNYAIITEHPDTESLRKDLSVEVTGDHHAANGDLQRVFKTCNGHSFLHVGETGAGTKHAVASGLDEGPLSGGLDVSLRVEINPHDRDGKTRGFGLSIPPLRMGL